MDKLLLRHIQWPCMDGGKLSKTLEEMDKKFDRIITALVSHGKKLDIVASKEDLKHFQGAVMNALDKRMIVLRRLHKTHLKLA